MLYGDIGTFAIAWVLVVILFFLFCYVVLFGLINIAYPKSTRNRKLISDLYVIGKIKQIAKNDGIDLDLEMKELLRMEKYENMGYKQLDRTIELELQEKIAYDFEKAKEDLDSKSKKKE